MNEQARISGANAKEKRRKRQLLSPRFVESMLAGHSALGLAFAALIYIVCLTGTLCVFLHEFHRWEQPDAPVLAGPMRPAAITAATQAGYHQALAGKGGGDLFLIAPSALLPRFTVHYHDDATGNEGEWIADSDGKFVARVSSPWAEFLAGLHMYLHLPRTWGLFLVGLTGVALLSSLISGILAHPRIFKDAFALRWGGSKRLQEADSHNRLGVWGLPFHVVVSLTGALLGLSTLIVGVLALAAYNGDSQKAFAEILGPHAAESTTPGPVPDINPMIAAVQRDRPDAVFVSAQFQHIATSGQLVHLSMRTPGHLAFSNQYYFDGNGNSRGHGGFEEGGIGQQILGVLQPLHFGWFGGIGTKIMYAILGLALTIVTQSGVTIWLARRRDKGLPAERWERIWAATVWGQPLALAVAALTSFFAPAELLIAIYLAVTAASLAASMRLRDARTIRAGLQAATAATIAATAIVHGALWHSRATDPMLYWIDGALIVTALVLAAIAAGTARAKPAQA